MRWIQKIGWPRPQRSFPGRRHRKRNDRRAPGRRHDPLGPDRSYAAYAASWDELEWEPVWVFAPAAAELDPTDRLVHAAPLSSEQRSTRVRARMRDPHRRMSAGPVRISRSGALLFGLGAAMLGLALAPMLPVLTPPIRMGLTATAAVALFGSFLVLRGGGGSLEHG